MSGSPKLSLAGTSAPKAGRSAEGRAILGQYTSAEGGKKHRRRAMLGWYISAERGKSAEGFGAPGVPLGRLRTRRLDFDAQKGINFDI